MNRRDFYFRQRVTEAELDETFDKVELADWAIVAEILGYGFLGTPSASQKAPIPDLTVILTALLGYDQLGRRLEIPSAVVPYNVNCAVDEVAAPTAVAAPGNEKWLSLFVEFDRALSDPRTDGNGSTVYWKRDESFVVNVVQAAEQPLGTNLKPVLRSDQVLLCDIHLIFGQTQILNADISHTRREGFTLTGFLHGDSHRELGADPVPNATAVDGGIMSAVDKGKLDGITWTGAGVAALLGRIGRAYQPANQVIPAATSMNVNAAMVGKVSGGGAGANGVCTTPPENLVPITDINGDDFLSPAGDKVYARLTYSAPNWLLSFYTYPSGGPETAFNMTPFSGGGAVFKWYCQEVFRLDNFPFADPMFAITSDQVAGEIPDATTAIKGKVLLCPDGVATAGTVTQGNDSRLLPANALTVIRKLASKPSLIFYPHDFKGPGSPNCYDTYRLHQFHGLAKGDYQKGPAYYEPGDFYFEYDISHSDYPLDVTLNGSPCLAGPGHSDNTRPTFGANTWYYVYLIGRTVTVGKKYALVVSTRSPWSGGPLLDDTGVPPPGFKFWNGGVQNVDEGLWRYWRFIGCIVNNNAGAWELITTRKKGDHVEYELAQYMGDVGVPYGWTDFALASRVPPTSLRAFLALGVQGAGCEVIGKVRPPALGNQLLHDIAFAGWPPGGAPRSMEWKLTAWCREAGGVWVASERQTGWVDLNEAREVGLNSVVNAGPGSDKMCWLEVLGYEELDDSRNTEHAWP